MDKFTHFDDNGVHMVDVGGKDATNRMAIAKGLVIVNAELFSLIKNGKIEKGNVLNAAQLAGIMAAKRTSDIIPMCHQVFLDSLDISFELVEESCCIVITATVTCRGVTGVEMEALTAVSVAALTIYDMCKSVQRDILISEIYLAKKTGGKNG